AAATPAVANQAMIVFDGSGSMAGRIDGQTKIDIQRATLGRVFADAPETLAVGLMAYGHRQKESCSDVELLAAPDVGQVGAVMRAAEKIRPLGRSPITQAVK